LSRHEPDQPGTDAGTSSAPVADPVAALDAQLDSQVDSRVDPVGDGIEAVQDLVAAGIEVDGEVQVAESTWVVYGHTSYDGEVIVGEYHDAAEASEVLRAVPRPQPAPEPDPETDPHPG
jgi:hypothetical protein